MINYLQSHGLTTREILSKEKDINDEFELKKMI